MDKRESILAMESMDLNTLDYFMTSDEKEVTHYLAKHMDDKLSLRTQRNKEYQCPFYYMMPGKELLPLALKHLGEGYSLILAPSLDTKGCLMFGTVMYQDDSGDSLEFVVGEGKVRDLDNHPKRRYHYIGMGDVIPVRQKDVDIDSELVIVLNHIYKDIKDACYDQIPCIVEWSYYDHPVGRLKKRLICWEIRETK